MTQATGKKAARQKIDAIGLSCPEPLMLVHAAINRIEPGETIEVIGNDPASVRDISKLCHFLNHRIVLVDETGESFSILIEKQ